MVRRILLCLIPLCCLARGSEAQFRARVFGVIRDSASGSPIVGAKVAALRAQLGRIETDSAGRYRFERLEWPEFELELNCPSRTLLGKRLLVRTMRVPANSSVRVDLVVNGMLCDEPPLNKVRGEFRGAYSVGFEESSFQICADSTLGLPPAHPQDIGRSAITAWVEYAPRARQQKGIKWPKDSERHGIPLTYVRWRGTLTGPGAYGHLGVSDYLFEVDSIVRVAAWNGGACLYEPQ
jgi:hypothetical protein